MTREQFEYQGYTHVRQLPTGEWIGVFPFIYTTGLVVGLNSIGYRTRFCYEHLDDAIAASVIYDGTGDPSGPWIKEKGERGERMGPGATV